ncbi:glycoporin, partial [Salmonella enterica subsp. enterica serovar Derby]
MKAKYLALMIGACFSHNLWAANNITIEQRLAELEQRVVNAEKRASDAEAQIRSLKQQQVAATPTVNVQSAEPIAADKTPPKLTLSGFSDIKFYGDVEFNMDAASRSGSLTSMRTSAN